MRAALVILCAVATGCGGKLPAPTITSVTPATTPASSATLIKVQLSAVLPSKADFDTSTATSDPSATVYVGDINVAQANVDSTGAVTGFVPTVFLPGKYDVKVVLADGRQAVSTQGFEVTPGTWPSSYSIDPVPDQQQGTPFAIKITALGQNAGQFDGTVALSVNKGGITPSQSAAFVNGVLTQSVTLNSRGSGFVITVKDVSGATGTSNAFKVN